MEITTIKNKLYENTYVKNKDTGVYFINVEFVENAPKNLSQVWCSTCGENPATRRYIDSLASVNTLLCDDCCENHRLN